MHRFPPGNRLPSLQIGCQTDSQLGDCWARGFHFVHRPNILHQLSELHALQRVVRIARSDL